MAELYFETAHDTVCDECKAPIKQGETMCIDLDNLIVCMACVRRWPGRTRE